jgi:ankyrin repeat protein
MIKTEEQGKLDRKLIIACWNGHIAVVKKLLKNGADINMTNKYGNTPFHLACSEGYTEIVKLLLEKGANINTVDKFDQTPLHIACFLSNFPCSSVLIIFFILFSLDVFF